MLAAGGFAVICADAILHRPLQAGLGLKQRMPVSRLLAVHVVKRTDDGGATWMRITAGRLRRHTGTELRLRVGVAGGEVVGPVAGAVACPANGRLVFESQQVGDDRGGQVLGER